MFKHIIAATCALALTTSTAIAATWTVDSDASVIGFGSIKGGDFGEPHTISGVTGTVSADGTADITLDLSTVQTNIDIRNERIGEFVFDGATTATLTAAIDIEALTAMPAGDHVTTEVEGTLSLLGIETPVFLDMFIMRTTDDQVIALSNSMLFLSTEEIGIDGGIDVLMDLAGLPSITRAFPVTMRFVFNADA